MSIQNNIGFHYYEDAQNYTRSKLDHWLNAVGGKSKWTCLKSSCKTAIPQITFDYCKEHGVQPILQLSLKEWEAASEDEISSLLLYYKKMNVEYLQLDGYLNQRITWKDIKVNQNFLHQITDTVIKFHRVAVAHGFMHVLPKLFPGGDLWDLVVLRYLLQEFKKNRIATNSLILSFVSKSHGRPLLWGKGGKRKWGQTLPYQEVLSGEDHRGFMGFEWYQEVAIEEIGKRLPIILLEAGQDEVNAGAQTSQKFFAELFRLIENDQQKKLFPNVIGICFSWDGKEVDPVIKELFTTSPDAVDVAGQANDIAKILSNEKPSPNQGRREKCISHYLLLPSYEWGIAPWHLEVALPYIRKYQPTIGYSLEEAKLASFVTVVMDADVFTDAAIEALKKSGCTVSVIQGDGTEIAALLAAE